MVEIRSWQFGMRNGLLKMEKDTGGDSTWNEGV